MTTLKIVTDDGHRIDVYQMSSRLIPAVIGQAEHAASILPCREGTLVTTAFGQTAFGHGDRSSAVCYALGIPETRHTNTEGGCPR